MHYVPIRVIADEDKEAISLLSRAILACIYNTYRLTRVDKQLAELVVAACHLPIFFSVLICNTYHSR